MTYSEKLKDPRWQRLRLKTLEAAGWECESCGDSTKTLHVHHKQYRKGAEPWEYEQDDLAVLCEQCHAGQHEIKDRLNKVLMLMDNGSETLQVLGYANAIHARWDERYTFAIDTAEEIEGVADATRNSPAMVLQWIIDRESSELNGYTIIVFWDGGLAKQ